MSLENYVRDQELKEANKYAEAGKEWRYSPNGTIQQFDQEQEQAPENFDVPGQVSLLDPTYICMNCAQTQKIKGPCQICGHEEMNPIEKEKVA